MVCGYTHLKFEFVRYTYLNDDVWVYPFPVFLTHDFRYTHRGSPARLCTALMLRRCGGGAAAARRCVCFGQDFQEERTSVAWRQSLMSQNVIVLHSSDSEDNFADEPPRGTCLFRSLHLLFEDP